MKANQYGKVSQAEFKAVCREGRTILEEVGFTAPFKIMKPFCNAEHPEKIKIMLLSASAGIMEGDRQELSFSIGSKSQVELTSQSYEKIHRMEEGNAKRNTHIKVAGGGVFLYRPLPVIPFADSSFISETEVDLEDASSVFMMEEILSCGRAARGERFAYRSFINRVRVNCAGRLIYADNTVYVPEHFPMNGTGWYEGYTHQGNMLFCGCRIGEETLEEIREYMEICEEIEGGISITGSGCAAVRILGRRAEVLEKMCKEIAGKIVAG